MGIFDHKREVKIIINNNIKNVWEYYYNKKDWVRINTDEATWMAGRIYVADNKYAELRKEWYDRGNPQLEISYDGLNWYDADESDINWGDDGVAEVIVRIKKTEWETPYFEDPIQYHAKRLNGDWIPDWTNKTQSKWFIRRHCDVYTTDYGFEYEVVGATYMTKDTAIKIASALNNGDLKLNKGEIK